MRISEPFVAGVPKVFNIVGNFFRLEGVTGMTPGSVTVEFFSGARKLNLELSDADPGDYARAWPDGFDAVSIVSLVNETVTFKTLRGQVGSDRINGTVQVLEGGKLRTLTGASFQSYALQLAVAAQSSYVQLWNLPGSGKNLIVNKLQVTAYGVVAIYTSAYNAALTTLSMTPKSKLLGGAASTAAQARAQASAAPLVTTDMQYVSEDVVAKSIFIPMVEPIIVPPGQGLTCAVINPNTTLSASFDHFEEPV